MISNASFARLSSVTLHGPDRLARAVVLALALQATVIAAVTMAMTEPTGLAADPPAIRIVFQQPATPIADAAVVPPTTASTAADPPAIAQTPAPPPMLAAAPVETAIDASAPPLAAAAPPADLPPSLAADPATAAAPEPTRAKLKPHRPTKNPASLPHDDAESPAPLRAAQSPQPSQAPPLVTASATASADAESALGGRVREAVQQALRYPPAARMMNLHGRARVLLEYHAGLVDRFELARSAGSPLLDDAAMAAAREARYPKPPPEIGDRSLKFLVWVDFT